MGVEGGRGEGGVFSLKILARGGGGGGGIFNHNLNVCFLVIYLCNLSI